MKNLKFENYFHLQKESRVPVYRQLSDAVLLAVQSGILNTGDRMPSINQLSKYYDISRATVEKSYGDLRNLGILASHQGKSFFIDNAEPSPALKILMLFNQLNDYNKLVYDSFTDSLGPTAQIDFYIYHNSAAHLRHLLKKRNDYSHFVIIPNFLDEPEKGREIIDRLPKDKLILLGKNIDELSGKFGAVYENFSCNIYDALTQLKSRLRKYHTINLIHRENDYIPTTLTDGFVSFCENNRLSYKIRPEITRESVQDGEAFVVISDEQMMLLLREINDLNLVTGKHIGVISYNENNAKKVIMNGLTTISTDFKGMGRSAAQMVLTGSLSRIENPFHLTLRSSV